MDACPWWTIMNKAGALPNDFQELVTREFGDPWWHDVMGYYDGTEDDLGTGPSRKFLVRHQRRRDDLRVRLFSGKRNHGRRG